MADLSSPQEILRRADNLRGDRQTTETNWQELADYIMPSREFTTRSSPGEKRHRRIYHTGPVMAAEQMAGALHGMLTSPALRWFALRPDDERLASNQGARVWFDGATDMMYRMFTSPNARFDLHLHENYLDQSAFGTSVLFVGDRARNGMAFKALPLSESYLSENDDGVMDTLYRCYTMRANDVVASWGSDVPEELRREAENKPDTRWDVVHCVYPDPKSPKVYSGQYVLKRVMKAMGTMERFEDRPFVAARWSKRSGESYGTGAGMNALPDIQVLNALEEEHLRGVMLANAPPLALPDDGFLMTLNQQPRALNYYRSELGEFSDRVFPINTAARPEVAMEKLASMEQRIATAFYIQWMNLPFKANMTATEVIQRRDEMLRLMGPMVARLQTELLGPVIERTFSVMWRNGQLPPVPTELAGVTWHVEYTSPLALAQKSSDAASALNFMAALGQMAAGDPTVMDVVDGDEMARFLADRMGAPVKAMRDSAGVVDLRRARAARDAQMQNAMAGDALTKMMQQGGAGVKALAEASQVGAAAA